MKEVFSKAIAIIEDTDEDRFGPNGGFTAVLSSPSLDRDGDRLARDEWQEPLPERLPLDIDHGMSVADTVGSFHPYFREDGVMMMDAYFASTPKAQETRTLIREGHIGSVSVAFMTDKSKKSGEARRELLNAGIVAIPSNRDAVILASKAADLVNGVLRSESKASIPGGGDLALTQAIHDASVHLGADCSCTQCLYGSEDPTGASEGANTDKSVEGNVDIKDMIKFSTESGESVSFASHAEARTFFADMISSIDDAEAKDVQLVEAGHSVEAGDDAGLTKEQFEAALSDVLDPQDSPADVVDSPAEAAAATDEVPAPADEAADEIVDAADDVDPSKRARDMNMALFASQFNL